MTLDNAAQEVLESFKRTWLNEQQTKALKKLEIALNKNAEVRNNEKSKDD